MSDKYEQADVLQLFEDAKYIIKQSYGDSKAPKTFMVEAVGLTQAFALEKLANEIKFLREELQTSPEVGFSQGEFQARDE